jgi:hypothetical protein
MIFAQRSFRDCNRPPIKRLGLVGSPGVAIEIREIL